MSFSIKRLQVGCICYKDILPLTTDYSKWVHTSSSELYMLALALTHCHTNTHRQRHKIKHVCTYMHKHINYKKPAFCSGALLEKTTGLTECTRENTLFTHTSLNGWFDHHAAHMHALFFSESDVGERDKSRSDILLIPTDKGRCCLFSYMFSCFM